MDDKTILSIVAIAGVVTLDSIALLMGHNGMLLVTSIGAVCGIGGYQLKSVRG